MIWEYLKVEMQSEFHAGAKCSYDGPETARLVCSAIPYVNNTSIHFGNLIGSVLSADIYARYWRQRSAKVLFLGGGDCYGAASMISAYKEKIDPKELCERNLQNLKNIFIGFNISTDVFSSTMNPHHARIVDQIFKRLYAGGYVEIKEIEQLYSDSMKMFLPDRFIVGICPGCDFADAHGDQCDGCGAVLDPLELKNPRCSIDGSIPVIKKTKHYYLNLESVRSQLVAWMEESKPFWSANTYAVTKSFLDKPIKPRCITRDLSWGVPVDPVYVERDLNPTDSKTFYVWFEAVLCYLDFIADGGHDIEQFWCAPNVEIAQFFGKDNIFFHTILLPGILLAASNGKVKYNLAKHISATEYLQYEGAKFSKSRNYGIFCADVLSPEMLKDIPVDIWRYYLLSVRPESADANFSWNDFSSKVDELADTVGNLVHRVLTFRHKNYSDVGVDSNYKVQSLLDNYNRAMEKCEYRSAIRVIHEIAAEGNRLIQSEKIWELSKTNPVKCMQIIGKLLAIIKTLAWCLKPFTPDLATTIEKYVDNSSVKPEVLIRKVTPEKLAEYKKRFGTK